MPRTKREQKRWTRIMWVKSRMSAGMIREDVRDEFLETFDVGHESFKRDWRTSCQQLGVSSGQKQHQRLVAASRLNDLYNQAVATKKPAFCGSCKDKSGRPLQMNCPACNVQGVTVEPALGPALGTVNTTIKLFHLDGPSDALASPKENSAAATKVVVDNIQSFSTKELNKIAKHIDKTLRHRAKRRALERGWAAKEKPTTTEE